MLLAVITHHPSNRVIISSNGKSCTVILIIMERAFRAHGVDFKNALEYAYDQAERAVPDLARHLSPRFR